MRANEKCRAAFNLWWTTQSRYQDGGGTMFEHSPIIASWEAAYALQESRLQVAVKALQDVSDNYDPTNPEKMIQEIRAALKQIGVSNE